MGEVPLDAPDLGKALDDLANKARLLDPTGIRTKVVVPNQQIKYLQFESDSRDVDILEAQVRSALDGATPYHLSELAYDWSMSEGDVYVAAVAIETLTEAETFAVDHQFGPLSFVAIPENGAFMGEPFFGETVHAGELLVPGEIVLRDEDSIVILGAAQLPEPEPAPEPEPVAPEPVAKVVPEPAPEPADAKPETPPEPKPLATEAVDTAPAVPEKPVTDAPTQADDVPPAPAGFRSARQLPPSDAPAAKDPAPKPASVPAKPAPAADDNKPPAAPKPEKPAEPVVAFTSARRAAPPDVDSTKAPNLAELPERRFNPAGTTPPPAKDTGTKAKAEPPKPAKPAAKSPAPTKEDAKARSATLTAPAAPIRPAEKPSKPASKHPGRLPFMSKRKSAETDASPTSESREKGSGLSLGIDMRGALGKAKSAAAGLASSGAKLKPKPKLTPAQASAVRAREDEKQRMTVFGARNPGNTTPESSPRFFALALTAGLLFFLVGVAAWAALFLEDGISGLFRSSEDVQFAEDPAAIEAPAEIAAVPEPEVEADTRETEEVADEDIATLTPDASAISEELSPDEARARYAATGIWQMSPQASRAPVPLEREEVYQTSLDPELNFSDAVAIPDVATLLDTPRPATPASPPPPGTDFDRDNRGFIAATPEGTVTPEGVTVFAGPPPITPPETPDRPDAQVAEAAVAPEPAEQSATIRPRARPDDLSETFERSNNGGRTLAELQDIRPRLRPKSAQDQALEAAGISTVIEEDSEDLLEDATDEAVAVSLKPRARPAGFSETVEATRQAAAAEPVSIEQRVTVDIPTTASVARAATENNQISLRRVNLIGVYGSSDSRRALVRLPNGRYLKVQVGDRLDGGQVAAIGDDELRYIKRGQSVVLKMPTS